MMHIEYDDYSIYTETSDLIMEDTGKRICRLQGDVSTDPVR